MRYLSFLLILSLLFGCRNDKSITLHEGVWRAELQVTETEVLPFNFEVTSPDALKIFNADEVIMVTDLSYSSDTVVFKAPVFEGYIKAVLKKDRLEGEFIKESLDRVVPFSAEFGVDIRFNSSNTVSNSNVTGVWETVFSPDSEDDRYIAKGIFTQDGNRVTGTFRTTTGDYRYLEGMMDGETMKLSTFDGAHAFLFTAKVSDSTMTGMFYSGNHWQEPFTAKRNEAYELPDANSLTYLNEGYERLSFRFPNAEGQMVSLDDAQFNNKVVVVQIMGTWCPNCLDESRFYSEYYDNNAEKDIEFIALAFEYAKTEEKAFRSIKRLKDDVGIQYPILLAQYGTSSKSKAQEKLPMLNHVLSYPTSVFIDKQGNVRKIHTGFNGPATGMKYIEFKEEFDDFVKQLLSE
ncbi:TlpA disulfide reductase family protein [Psychroserpens sp.]|uniref:peroxiredoxin family protein n=1 Tax=Psychroserpens sp. TaxID=2020870 RepID=UPI001B185C40|nr:TlpA disulfide reductase family protein [Psychroserpens sp.]MBO6607461.1 TlpA family protein disulfide reductase [Psychroserpens sp.]MBO6654461.1 TlpA family protein disulfide reductase [Psychroserpens sp.]MBO6681190.1 TlpA family protein disulfide reductase [Psychroserpens sp.]MBO6749853.1 TlpA family protein disulfide reductase [Psychroserpens sp.]MBO6916159.1 TlpA family protein disulfide reductase [Psychroserpens sp.]